MKITFVKKILASGEPCQKCEDVEQRLQKTGQLDRIDATLIADERDDQSAGMLLAKELGVERAPFFIVDNDKDDLSLNKLSLTTLLLILCLL